MSATTDRTDPPAAGQTPPIPVTLRAVAAWLESHPEIEAQIIDLPIYGRDITVIKSYGRTSVFTETLVVQGLGLEPTITTTGGADRPLFKVSADVAPGIRLDLVGPA